MFEPAQGTRSVAEKGTSAEFVESLPFYKRIAMMADITFADVSAHAPAF
jgi:hypothetical protein